MDVNWCVAHKHSAEIKKNSGFFVARHCKNSIGTGSKSEKDPAGNSFDTKCPSAGCRLQENEIGKDGRESAGEQETVDSVGSAGGAAEGKPLSELHEVFGRDAESGS